MKKKKIRILVEIILLVSGIALLYICLYSKFGDVLTQLAYSFITASLTALFFEFILDDSFESEIKSDLEKIYNRISPDIALKDDLEKLYDRLSPDIVLLNQRQELDYYYENLISNAKEINVIALSGQIFIEKLGEIIIHKIKNEQCNIRLLILKEQSGVWKYRLKDDRGFTKENLHNDYLKVEQYFEKVKSDCLPKPQGTLTVKAHSRLPYFAYCKCDAKMVLGFYLSHKRGSGSHAYVIEEKSPELYDSLNTHFHTLWSQAEEELLRIAPWR